MKMKKNRFLTILATVILIAITSYSCEKDKDQDTLPELPPVEALMMDFSKFIDDPNQGMKSETYFNAPYAYATVFIWNVLVSVPMIVPVAAYLESFKHTPVYLGDNKWQWSYSVTGGGKTYTARLVTTRISNEEFTAEMLVSDNIAMQDFKWFEGTIRYDRTNADWTMYDPQDNLAWLEIEWNMDWEKEVSDMTYTIVKEGNEEFGSYITFGITDETDYDAYYTISRSVRETMIEWNLETSVGRVKDTVQFGDDLWHCWNELFQDVDCN
jgi:hypothetical protein